MFKCAVVVLSLVLVSEALKNHILSVNRRTLSRNDELYKLNRKYENLIYKNQTFGIKNLNYEGNMYRGAIVVYSPGQEIRIVFNTKAFHNIYSKGLLQSSIYGFHLKNALINKNGISNKSYTGAITYVPFTSETYWQFEMATVVNGSKVCDNCQAIVDVGSTLIVVPDAQYNKVMNATGAIYDADYNTYTVNCSNIESLPALQFYIRNTTFTLEPKTYIIKSQDICWTAFVNIGTKVWILSDIFIQKYYTIYDLANKRVGFALASSTSLTFNSILNKLITPMAYNRTQLS